MERAVGTSSSDKITITSDEGGGRGYEGCMLLLSLGCMLPLSLGRWAFRDEISSTSVRLGERELVGTDKETKSDSLPLRLPPAEYQ